MSSPKRPTKQPAPQPPELAAIEQPREQPTEQPTEQPAEQPTEQATEQTAAALAPSVPDDLVAHSITVRCKRPTGIWRGGRFWPAAQVTVSLDNLTEEQTERIVTEPLLDFAFIAGEPAQ